MVHVTAAALPILSPDAIEGFQGALEKLSAYDLPFKMGFDEDVVACDDDADCLNELAAVHQWSPYIMGSIIAHDAVKFHIDDGFNMDGTNNGQCQYNCRPYADTTGYEPKNIGAGNSSMRNWQPLLEDDGRGFYFRQEHVTPHIGQKAVPRILTRDEINSREVDDPQYNLTAEAAMVVDRLASIDDRKKMEVELFDNKGNVISLLSTGLVMRYLGDFTLERLLLFTMSYVAAEYDAVILSWKEKVRHDLVRPTTVIQQRRYQTPPEITTWAGPNQGIQTFDAKEFQPYNRIMPHAEYPSGSSCICQSNLESIKTYMKVVFGDDATGFSTFKTYSAGSSKVEPGATPASDLTLVYNSLEEVIGACGQSRLDGGMHFTAAVDAGYQLCSGFGSPYEEYIKEILNGSTDLITTYFPAPGGSSGNLTETGGNEMPSPENPSGNTTGTEEDESGTEEGEIGTEDDEVVVQKTSLRGSFLWGP